MYKLIGNTPIIKLKYKYKGREDFIYVKLEQYNLTGSIKDRMALYIIEEERKKGILKDNMSIIEATSGNTGISFSALGAYLNHPVYIFMPDWASKERIKLMESYGAKVNLISKEDGGFQKCIALADQLAKEINGYRPNQFSNPLNSKCHYENTGNEIINQIKEETGGFVSGIGSGGTLMGISKRLKEKYPNIKIGVVEPLQMPLLTTNKIIRNHKIEGIGDDFIPSIVDFSLIDEIITINDEDAINTSRILSKKYGLGIGISSGANLLASIITAKNNDNIVTIFADDNKKYLTTSLNKAINPDKKLISNYIEIISIESL